MDLNDIRALLDDAVRGPHGCSELRALGELLDDVYESVSDEHAHNPPLDEVATALVNTLDELASQVATFRQKFWPEMKINGTQRWLINAKDAETGATHYLGDMTFTAGTTHAEITAALIKKYWGECDSTDLSPVVLRGTAEGDDDDE